MSEFFSHYPKVPYNVTGVMEPTRLKTAVNIMNRTKIKDVLLCDIVQFEQYSIPENESIFLKDSSEISEFLKKSNKLPV